MRKDIRITNTTTGETRVYTEENWNENSEFIWEEGNYSCDCNRALFFAWAIGEEEENEICGTNRYEVEY